MKTETVKDIAARWGFDSDRIEGLDQLLDNTRNTYARVSALAEAWLQEAPINVPWQVEAIEGRDPHHAWMYRTRMQQQADGPLAGLRLVVKDSIAVAGVPMHIGSRVLGAGFVPQKSATAVARAISAGADLVGTAVCEDLCYSGSSFTAATGAVTNPYDQTRSAGGSTSGCAALIALGEADIGLGTDLGGSVRNPAAWCGVLGLKPSFGLVPYTGAVPTEVSMDHLGLLARRAEDMAALLEAVAGKDVDDPRQQGLAPALPCAGPLGDLPANLRIGLLQEGFGWPEKSDPQQDQIVTDAVRRLEHFGAGIGSASVPLFRAGRDIHVPLSCEGGYITVFETRLQGSNHAGAYDADLAASFGHALETNAEALPLNGKVALLAGSLMQRETHGAVRAQAQALRAILRAQIDKALEQYDVLALPTTPMPPHKLPSEALKPASHQALAFEMHDNNCVANLTGHPALSLPCGMIGGLPVGLLLIGRPMEDRLLLHIAAHFQNRIYPAPSAPHLPSEGALK